MSISPLSQSPYFLPQDNTNSYSCKKVLVAAAIGLVATIATLAAALFVSLPFALLTSAISLTVGCVFYFSVSCCCFDSTAPEHPNE